jgi:uncharacterized protein (DUF1015 family)
VAKPRLLPFRALRYDADKAGPLSDITCPPYDVIAREEQVWLYSQHPLNAVRLEHPLPAGQPGDEARFAQARETMKQWLDQGVLRIEERPAIYVYRQRFQSRQGLIARWGFFCLLGLADYSAGEVLPHEGTMARPKSQRTTLLRTCKAHFSPIMCLYQSEQNARRILQDMATTRPLLQTDNEQDTVWMATDQQQIQAVFSCVSSPVLIADGHHRYEAALAYLSEAADPTDAGAAANYILAVLIEARDPGLIILPAHRMVRFGAGQRAHLERQIAEHCTTAPVSGLGEIERGIAGGASVGYFDLEHGYRLLTFRKPPEPTHLDALHSLLLECSVREEGGGSLAYVVANEQAVGMVERGEFDAAILVAPLAVNTVVQGANRRLRFPKKATYFYPKLPAGLIMSPTGADWRVP